MLVAIFWASAGQRKEHERSMQAEWSLRESEMRAGNVMESALDVVVMMDRTETALRISVAAGGKGFGWSQYLDLNVTRSTNGHGHGIALAKAISFDKLDFRGCGLQVVVSVSLKRIDAESWPEEERKVA